MEQEINLRALQSDPVVYFNLFDEKVELKVSRDVAKLICTQAIKHLIWILGIDVGVLYDDGKYKEDYSQGWVTKTALISLKKRKNFKKGLTYSHELEANNREALHAISDIPEVFNAYVITAKRMELIDALK